MLEWEDVLSSPFLSRMKIYIFLVVGIVTVISVGLAIRVIVQNKIKRTNHRGRIEEKGKNI